MKKMKEQRSRYPLILPFNKQHSVFALVTMRRVIIVLTESRVEKKKKKDKASRERNAQGATE